MNKRFYRNAGGNANQRDASFRGGIPHCEYAIVGVEMSERIYNFSAGPSAMPTEVLERAKSEFMSVRGSGMSVMEISHRSPLFDDILQKAESGLRAAMKVPDNYRVLFIQGGATLQFSMIPMNLLSPDNSADHIVTGHWGELAVEEAGCVGDINVVYSGAADGFTGVPQQGEVRFSKNASYVHYTSNETVDGVQFDYVLDAGALPVVCDMSSDILSQPIDVEKFAMIYAGAQKNLGPSGVVVVVIREDLLDWAPRRLPKQLTYKAYADNVSMPNTPNTWAIYLLGLMCDWLDEQGGAAGVQKVNREKARIFYEAIDKSDGFYKGRAKRSARSLMNVTFSLPSPDLDAQFVEDALKNGFSGLKGHKSTGGIRASIYNAFPLEGVKKFVDFMSEFERKNG